MRSPERPSKHEAFLALLQEGWTSLHLDARRPGVIVPPHLRAEPHLVLQYGHDLPIPIPDLEVDEHGVHATLSFSKNPQRTFVPWSSVYVVTCNDGRGVLYHEDVPEDVSIIATHPHGDRMPDDDRDGRRWPRRRRRTWRSSWPGASPKVTGEGDERRGCVREPGQEHAVGASGAGRAAASAAACCAWCPTTPPARPPRSIVPSPAAAGASRSCAWSNKLGTLKGFRTSEPDEVELRRRGYSVITESARNLASSLCCARASS